LDQNIKEIIRLIKKRWSLIKNKKIKI